MRSFPVSESSLVGRYERAPTLGVRERFFLDCSRDKETGCWRWKGQVHRGRALLSVAGRQEEAVRVGFVLMNGPLPAGVRLQRRCGESACVNPEHWNVGEPKSSPAPRQRKLDALCIAALRRGHALGLSLTLMSRMFDISIGTASKVIRAKASYRHPGEPPTTETET